MGHGWNAQLSCFPCIPHMRCAMHGHKRSSEPSRISHPPLHPFTMALPYDATPPPDAPPSLAGHSPPRAPSPLDRALDDFPPPPHVQSLVSRMSAAKVYLVDESPAVLHLDGHARLREPPLRRLAQQLDRIGDDGVHAWLDGVGAAHSVAVKPNAVYLSSELIQHLSTAKVFSWATGLGAEPMGIEWINDTTLHILFPSPQLSVLALALLSKTGFALGNEHEDQADDPLQERSAHPFPLSLLPRKPARLLEQPIETSLAPEQGTDTVTKRGRGQFASSPSLRSSYANDATLFETIPLEDGVNPLARIALRLALVDDMTVRQGGKESEWYKKHGFEAGKERIGGGAVRRPFSKTSRRERGERSEWATGDAQAGGEELAKRLGRERKPYDRPARSTAGAGSSGRSRGMVTQEELDRELESLRSGVAPRGEGEARMDIDEGQDVHSYHDLPRRKGRGFRGARGESGGGSRGRAKVGKDDLDRELDEMFANRGD
ncbi:hypothetical protein C360_06744 [Cryptococcus neoformans Bt15]|nr:hypothetical protein C360_06744 [Cryptococcus neoformans var. grubii Bt15]